LAYHSGLHRETISRLRECCGRSPVALLQRNNLDEFAKSEVFQGARIRVDLHHVALEKYFDVV
jgi:hypothetical protein